MGILICGSGTGMNIVANKYKNIRAAQCFNLKSTKLSRLHNDANIITLGSRLLSTKNALDYVKAFINKLSFESQSTSKVLKNNKPNIVFILLESWSADNIESLNLATSVGIILSELKSQITGK